MIGKGLEFTFGASSKVIHPAFINCRSLFLNALQLSMLCPAMPA
jgi:hypothetical protein